MLQWWIQGSKKLAGANSHHCTETFAGSSIEIQPHIALKSEGIILWTGQQMQGCHRPHSIIMAMFFDEDGHRRNYSKQYATTENARTVRIPKHSKWLKSDGRPAINYFFPIETHWGPSWMISSFGRQAHKCPCYVRKTCHETNKVNL